MHGFVSGAVVDGKYYTGYLVNQYPYMSSPPESIGWSETATDLGFVDGSGYSSGDIICHKSAKNGAISAEIKAGGKVEFQWTEWPESHHGPVITYMANCNGDCASVDKTSLEFFKIDESGLISDSNVPGTWASDNLIANNNSWTVTVPSSIAAGNYVMRHEIIALHSAGNQNGAQNYPQCINLKVTGGGSDKPAGTLGTALYKNTDAGILVNIYQSLSSYDIPGPALYSGASSGSSNSGGSASSSAAAPSATITQTSTAVQTSSATVYQPSTTTEAVTVTSTPAQQSYVQAPTATPSSTAGSSSSSGTLPSGSSLTEYFNSLSAEEFLKVLKETFSWLVTEKVHARDLSAHHHHHH
nr:AA9 [synthetic construct]